MLPHLYFLKENEQLLIESFTRRWTVNGPGRYVSSAFQRIKRRKGMTLGPTDYLLIRDDLTGKLRNEVGPKLYFLGANETVIERRSAIPLKKNYYLRIIDNNTGVIRVERGESSVHLSPTEQTLGEPESGINIDEHTAVLVRDNLTGQLGLITEPQVFVPLPTQEVAEIRQRILLAEHETAVIKDRQGQYLFKRGRDADRAFFLEPYDELVQLNWSTGIHKDSRSLKLTRIDGRPKFMWYEFEARTQDNVELVVGITFFWQIVDVESMIKTTDDTPGDVCSHARSVIIQAVSQGTLEKFLAEFNPIVREAVMMREDSFYAERGVSIHAIEVRSITCKDPATQHILHEIIQETTNRLNRIQKQDSENETKLKHLQGEIEAEQLKGQLLEIQREHARTEALTQGEAEANRIQAFLSGLSDTLSTADKVAIFNTLRKQETLEALSQGEAHLFFTPSDVDLRINS